ncbi:hypothetical protein KSF78_0004162, partial [Schistosoma japonicum]
NTLEYFLIIKEIRQYNSCFSDQITFFKANTHLTDVHVRVIEILLSQVGIVNLQKHGWSVYR